MRICPGCGNENLNDNKFCGKCGFKLPEPKICPECGYASFENQFCIECGEQLLPKFLCKKIKKMMREAFHVRVAQHNEDDALKLYNDILDIVPDYSKALYYKARILSGFESYDDALECINQALDINPYNNTFISTKTFILRLMKKHDESLEYIDSILDSNPFDDSLLEIKGKILFSMGKTDEAIKFYEKSLEINPKNSNAIREIISALLKYKRYDEALMYCEYIKDDEFIYYLNKIHIYREMKEYSKALACCFEFNRSNPSNYHILSLKGDIYLEIERYDAALRCYDKVLNHNPDDDSAILGKFEVLIKKEKFDEARDILSKFSPKYKWDWNTLASKYIKLNDFDKALECCDESLKVRENLESFFLKAKIYFELKKYEDALDYAKRALDKDCSNEKLIELIDNINNEINGCV